MSILQLNRKYFKLEVQILNTLKLKCFYYVQNNIVTIILLIKYNKDYVIEHSTPCNTRFPIFSPKQ